MEKMPAVPTPGAIVEARGEAWRVARSEVYERCALVTLQGTGNANYGQRLQLLSPYDRLQTRSEHAPFGCVGRQACLRRAAQAAADAHPWNGLWTASVAKIDLLPWQLEPALAVLDGASRLLLADAVGLGKTIQAGLILAELLARGLIERALVLTPAGLRGQWVRELKARFDIDAVEFDPQNIARTLAALPVGANPWMSTPVAVSSIDLVKRPEHAAALDHVDLELLIVDEAHHVTPGTDRGAVVARLARRCQWTVMATATPHSGDERAFTFLQALGSTGRDGLTVFRRGREVSRPSTRRTRLCRVTTTAAEADMHKAVEAYARAIWGERGATDESARLVAMILARRAASSAAALLCTLERRRLLTSGGACPVQSTLPWDEPDDRDSIEPETVLRVQGLADAERERDELDRLIAFARVARAGSSKTAWVLRFLRRAREPIVVFSEYRDTIDDLRQAMAFLPLAVLHGGLSPAERRHALDGFVGGAAQVLLATDAAGEGLNLQQCCRTIINMELPWNPVRLEQRVGRVDRLGQRRPVHAAHLFHVGTIEERVLAELHRRVARASAATGPLSSVMGAAAVRAVADAAIGSGQPPQLHRCPPRSTQVARATVEAERLLSCRRLLGLATRPGAGTSAPPHRAGVVSLSRHRGRRCSVMLCVFESIEIDGHGRLSARHIVPLLVELKGPAMATRASARGLAATLDGEEGLKAAVHAALSGKGGAPVGPSGWLSRLVAMHDATRRVSPELFQGSLFERREQLRATEHAAERGRRLSHLERRVASVRALASTRLVEAPRLIAAWPVETEPDLLRRPSLHSNTLNSER